MAPATQQANVEDPSPTLNRFAQLVLLGKGETAAYIECVNALGQVHAQVDAKAGSKDSTERLLTRLTQFGYLRVSSVEALLNALRTSGSKESSPLYTRLLFYLVQLALGDGSAGTPLPMPPNRSSLSLPKAVDTFGPEVLSAAWADLSDEKAPFMRKQGAMRVLAALAHAATTSKPDDATYPAGVFVTLQSLLERIDQLQASKKSLASILAATTASAGGAAAKKKNMLADFKKQMETWSLLRLAFSSARVALSKSGQVQIAQRSFCGVCSTDPVCARHSLALASLAAKEPGGAQAYLAHVGPPLQVNVDLGRRAETGMLYTAGGVGGKGGKAGAPPPAVLREEGANHLNVKDVFARVYLARGCAAALQGAPGDRSGIVLWEALMTLACGDNSDLVGLEAIKAMCGAPYPHAEPLRRARPAPLGEAELAEVSLQGRVYAGSWQMVMGSADMTLPIPDDGLPPLHEMLVAAQVPSATRAVTDESGALVSAQSGDPGGANSVFGRMVSRILFALQSTSRSLIAAGCKAAAVIFESRAWFGSQTTGQPLETDSARRSLRVLQTMVSAVFGSEGLGAVERAAAGEALLWAQLSTPEDTRSATITPGALLKAASQGGLGVQNVIKSLFADPWPEALAASFLTALARRARCSPALAPWCCELAAALAAGTPNATTKDLLMALWDSVSGPVGLRGAVELLGSPLPPVTQPASAAPQEVKAFAAMEEVAFEGLKSAAAWWIGEHANQLAGVADWKLATKASVNLEGVVTSVGALEPGERLALAATAHAPLLVLATTHLQRHMLSGSWEVRGACAQALGKIAVRSPEPYRIQAYAGLRAALAGPATTPAGQPGALTSWLDPLGLAPVALPMLEVLDAMYAGRMVLATHCNMYGAEASAWPPGALASVKRRHEWLLGVIAQRVGGVPAAFYPLGRKSRALLSPDEPPEAEVVEVDEDEKALDDAAEAAAAAAAAGGEAADVAYDEYGNPYDASYYADDGYYDESYNNTGGDALAKWQAGNYGADGGADYSHVAHVNWTGLGEGGTGEHYDTGYAQDEEDVRYGTVLYAFDASIDDEVTVVQGERVTVHVDMGDWLHVTNASGGQGIIPASYVQLDETGARAHRSPSGADNTPAPSQYYGGGGDTYGDMYGESYRPPYSAVYDNAGDQYGMYDRDGQEDTQQQGAAGGGFDDFGALLVQAAEARAAAAQKAVEKASQKQQGLQRNSSMASTNSGSLRQQASSSLRPTTSVASSVGLQSAYSMQSSIAGGAAPETPRLGGQQSAAQPFLAQTSWGGGGFSGGGAADNLSSGRPSMNIVEPAQASLYPANSFGSTDYNDQANTAYGAAQPAEDVADAAVTEEFPAGTYVRVAYDWVAEVETDLSVAQDDVLRVTGTPSEGWVTVVRESDLAQGTVPANYVTRMD